MTERNDPCRAPRHAPRDLHDRSIQRLFGAELTLLSALAGIPSPEVRERVRQSVAVLDEIIDDLRAALRPAAGRSDPPTD